MDTQPASSTPPAATTKRCVECKQDIPIDAAKCHYCRSSQQWSWDTFGKQTLPVMASLASLAVAVSAFYVAWHAKDSDIISTVHGLKMSENRLPPADHSGGGMVGPVFLHVILQITNNGSAPAFVELLCQSDGCMQVEDVVTGKSGKAIQIDPNTSRLVESTFADMDLAKLRALPAKELAGLCDRLVSQEAQRPRDFKYIHYSDWTTIRTTNQSGRVQTNYVIVPAKMLFECIRTGMVEKGPPVPIREPIRPPAPWTPGPAADPTPATFDPDRPAPNPKSAVPAPKVDSKSKSKS